MQRPRVGDRRDQDGEAERGREVAALVERRVEVLHLQEEEDRADERRDAEQLEQRQRPPRAARSTARRARAGSPSAAGRRACRCRSRRATDRCRVVEDPHQRRRGGDAGDRRASAAAAADEDEARDEQQRPDDVELLLHRERPDVLQQRRVAHQVEVRVVRDDLVPVRVVEERADRVAARAGEVVAREDRRRG